LDGVIIGNENAKLAIYEDSEFDINENNGFAHVSFHIKNFDDIIPVCEQLGITIKYGGPVEWPHSRSIYIDDPSGYEVELSEIWGGGL
jgi:catechol 2,3-dioxygenase-like lactoylglutathione lyase family enzyme